MLPRSREPQEGDFAVSLYISRYFVEGAGIRYGRTADNPIMADFDKVKRRGEGKNYEEPESYHIVKEIEGDRNAQ